MEVSYYGTEETNRKKEEAERRLSEREESVWLKLFCPDDECEVELPTDLP